MIKHLIRKQEGFATTLITLFVLILTFSIAFSMSTIIFTRQRIQNNLVKSSQAYYTAEAGLEDAMIRLRNNYSMSPLTYNLTINNTTTAVTIPAIVGVSRVPVSEADNAGIKRKVQAVYTIDSDAVGFNFGAQIGAGGLTTSNNSVINGNVFSNGNISGSGTITNNAIISGTATLSGSVRVNGNFTGYSCLSSAVVDGSVTYVSPGGTKTCTSGSTFTQSSQVTAEPLPISQSMIDGWKIDAEAGGVTTGDYILDNGAIGSLGPRKITGNLLVDNNSTLTVTGTLYVVGNINISNNALVRLDTSYGGLGGTLIADGTILLDNNGILQGSGQAGSYIMLLSTNNTDSAITITNNAAGAIFYTSAGRINISNNVSAKQITGYKIHLNNNAIVTYESGLANLLFTSGPSAGWKVTSWTEQ